MTVSLVKSPPVTTTKATFKATDLADALRVGSLFASTDKTIPMLHAVRLEFDGKALTALATDRYTAGLFTVDGEGDAFNANVSVAVVKQILTSLKGAPSYAPVEVIIEEVSPFTHKITVRTFDGEITATLNDGDFPKLRALIPDAHNGDGTGNVGMVSFDPAYLAKFAKVQTGRTKVPARFSLSAPMKPARVDIGENFVGVIMPMRIAK